MQAPGKPDHQTRNVDIIMAVLAIEITFASPQSWTSQEIPLPLASWNLHITAVWNTAA